MEEYLGMVNENYGFKIIDRKKVVWRVIVPLIVIALLVLLCFRIFGNEDDWIKDSKGIWIKHGSPLLTPARVAEQQNALECASRIYAEASLNEMDFFSQCLGTCLGYSVDIVNVPRTSEDDLKENQCSDFLEGKTKKFIELNREGQVVRIVG